MKEWENPMRAAIQAYRNVGVDALFGGIALPDRPEAITRTGFDRTRVRPDPRYNSPEDVLAKYVEFLPSSQDVRDGFDFETEYYGFISKSKEAQEELGESMLWLPGLGSAISFWMFGFINCPGQTCFGYKNYLSAIIRYKDAMRRYFEYFGELAYLQNDAIAKAIVEENLTPFVLCGSDICDNHGPMVSPKILDEIYFPYIKRALKPLRAKDIKIIRHCDGYITPIIHRLIDVGYDGFQGFQEETGVNLQEIMDMKTKSGKPLIILGSISVTTTLPFGTVEDVKADVERCINLADGRGGFFLMTANVAQPDVPVENIFAMYKHGIELGKGKVN